MESSFHPTAQSTDRQWPSPNHSIPAPPVPSPAPVTQDELRQLQIALRQRREADRLRKSILERLRAGADIESGSLTAEIEEKWARRFTRAALEVLWGTEYVEYLRQHLPETIQRHLKVLDQSSETEI